MPRLHHLADANPFDHYDSIAITPKALKSLRENPYAKYDTGTINIFGNVNVNYDKAASNLEVGHRLAIGQTSYIQNVYARTNCDNGSRAFHEWANATKVTMVIGDKPQRDWPLSTLLSRKHGDRPQDAIPVGEADAYFEELAAGLYEEYRLAGGTGRAWSDLPEVAPLGHSGQFGKKPWHAAARFAHGYTKAPQLMIVPDRQLITVRIDTNLTALSQIVESLMGEPPIAPMPLVWVHLEGFARRDVC